MEKTTKTTIKLFTPTSIGNLKLSHRIVLAPLTRFRAHKLTQVPTARMLIYYEQRASCGGGLLITEATSINANAGAYEGAPGIYTKEQAEVWKEVVKKVHAKRASIFQQLWHVGRSIHSSLIGGKQPVSSSPVPILGKQVRSRYTEACAGRSDPETPRALSVDEISEIVIQYGAAAQTAVEVAGFDGVEIHAANGYLPDQFLRDGVNQREDHYGGSFENRIRFLLEIVAEITSRIGDTKTSLRLSPFGVFNSMSDSNPLGLFTFLLEQLNIRYPNLAYVHLTACQEGGGENLESSLPAFRRSWKGRLVVNLAKIESGTAIKLVEDGIADMVSVGRDFLANPDFPFRWENDLNLNEYDANTFYTSEEIGYIDYPFHSQFRLS